MVKHVTAGEEQDRNEADGSPDVAVLNNGQHVRRGSHQSGTGAEDDGDGGDPSRPVDGSLDGGVRSVGEVSRDPCVDLFSFRGSSSVRLLKLKRFRWYLPGGEVISERLYLGNSMRTCCRGEQQEDRGGGKTELYIQLAWTCDLYKPSRSVLTDRKVSLPSAKSRVPKSNLDSAFLSPLVQLLASRSHSGWNSRQSWQPNLASMAVNSTATL